MMSNITTYGEGVSPELLKEIQIISNKMKKALSGRRSDAVFEALATVCAIYIKEYLMEAHKVGGTVTEKECYEHLGQRINWHLKEAYFVPEGTKHN